MLVKKAHMNVIYQSERSAATLEVPPISAPACQGSQEMEDPAKV